MLISTKIWLSISALMLGYLATVVVSSILAFGTERRLTIAADGLFPASVLSQAAMTAYRQQTQFYQDAVLLGEMNLLKVAETNATEVVKNLNAAASLPGLPVSRKAEITALLARLDGFTREAVKVYGPMVTNSHDEHAGVQAVALNRSTDEIKAQLGGLVKNCADDLRDELDETVVSTKSQRMVGQMVFVTVVTTSGVLMALVITRWTRRLKTLLDASERMSTGDFTAAINDRASDEVGRLSHSFSLMQEAVRARGRQLQQFNENLERTIAERTLELSQKNGELIKEFSERERAQFSLRLLESAVNQITDAVMITTAPEGQIGPGIVYVNPGFTIMTGYAAEEVMGKPPDLLFGEKTDRALMAHIFSELQAERSASGEAINYRKDGSEVFMEWNAAPLRNQQGKIINLVAVQRDISLRKQAEAEIALMHRQLLEASRHAGMAEVATGVLHNVGNVLNSVNVSATLVAEKIRNSKLVNLAKAVQMMTEHSHDLGAFLTTDERGQKLPLYLSKLAEHVAGERESTLKELTSLTGNIEHIKEIVSLQQSYGKSSGFTMAVKPSDLAEEALRLNAISLQRNDVRVIREYDDLPLLSLDKHKILQILVNLIGNARYALGEAKEREKLLTLKIQRQEQRLVFSVTDNGIGIPSGNMNRIFAHGFTTKKDGHGFGLHSCSLSAKEMRGSLSARSDGPGHGATFTLELPIKSEAV